MKYNSFYCVYLWKWSNIWVHSYCSSLFILQSKHQFCICSFIFICYPINSQVGKKKFGSNNNIGFSGGYKFKSNWILELSTDFIFEQMSKTHLLLIIFKTIKIDHQSIGRRRCNLSSARGQIFSLKTSKLLM